MKRIVLLSLSAGMIALIFSSNSSGPAGNGNGNHTGSAGSPANCAGAGCHAANTNSTTVTIGLMTLSNQPVFQYVPGTTYKVSIGGSNSSAQPKYGFQVSCVKDGTNTQAGTFSASGNMSKRMAGSIELVEHNTPIAATTVASGMAIYQGSFNWTAPAAGTGRVRFYVTLNAVNGNGTALGDMPNSTDSPYGEAPASGVDETLQAQLSVFPNPTTEAVHVKLPSGISITARIFDITGRAVVTKQLQVAGGVASINTSQLEPGNYFLMVEHNGQQRGAIFIKQ